MLLSWHCCLVVQQLKGLLLGGSWAHLSAYRIDLWVEGWVTLVVSVLRDLAVSWHICIWSSTSLRSICHYHWVELGSISMEVLRILIDFLRLIVVSLQEWRSFNAAAAQNLAAILAHKLLFSEPSLFCKQGIILLIKPSLLPPSQCLLLEQELSGRWSSPLPILPYIWLKSTLFHLFRTNSFIMLERQVFKLLLVVLLILHHSLCCLIIDLFQASLILAVHLLVNLHPIFIELVLHLFFLMICLWPCDSCWISCRCGGFFDTALILSLGLDSVLHGLLLPQLGWVY